MIRASKDIYGYERALAKAGFAPVAGADEAGRGACAGPLVAAAVVLSERPGKKIAGLADSKMLTVAKRERLYDEICQKAEAVSWVSIAPDECDLLGMQEADLQGLRRALLRLQVMPAFAITDGFAVDGLPVPGLAMWKADQVVACVAAASIIAKVTRDEIMRAADAQYPGYGFAVHKGYVTASHQAKLDELGPCAIHRLRYKNVRRVTRVGAL